MRTTPTAVFMAFGTKGDVYPIVPVAVSFACDQEHHHVVFITHSAHESLKVHLEAKGVAFVSVSSPPVLAPLEDNGIAGATGVSFSLQKKELTREHRKECVSIVESLFADGLTINGDVIIINFFALEEGWSLAELVRVLWLACGSTAAALHSGIPQVVCPLLLDQFYWAERMFWIGVTPEPLKRNQLLPDQDDDACIRKAADLLARELNFVLSPEVRARALDIAKRISSEDGVSAAVQFLKEEINNSSSARHS